LFSLKGPFYELEDIWSRSPQSYSKDLVLLGGLSFPDVVEVNFTLILDRGQQAAGANDATKSVTLIPLCEQALVDGFPQSAASASRVCGEPLAFKVSLGSEGESGKSCTLQYYYV
jgi:hypothetical protein